MRIDELAPGQSGVIEYVGGEGELRDRLLDMGLTPGTNILLRKAAPLGDPIQLSLRGYELTIRKADAARIIVVPLFERGCQDCKTLKANGQNGPADGEGRDNA